MLYLSVIMEGKLEARPSVSILMPIYNAGKYLNQSLTSVLQQTLPEIEIVCINDGSDDNSLDIIKKHAHHDKRITIINKANSGYGDSMNSGLRAASGKYIAILEPDDWYEPNMLEKLYSLASANHLDVIKSDFYQFSNRTSQDKQYHLFEATQCNKVLNQDQDTFIYSLQPSIWSAIYKQEFLTKNKIGFLDTPGASYQDTSFNFKVYAIADRVMFINKPLLHYRIDNSQSSINNIAKKLPYIDKEYNEIDRFIIEQKLPDSFCSISIACRYKTYLWAMEQLHIGQLKDYVHHVSNILRSHSDYISSIKCDRALDSPKLISNHPNIYYLTKSLRLLLHRCKIYFFNSAER